MSSSPPTHCWISQSPDSTSAAARALVAACEPARERDAFVIGLRGALGAGKTVFAKGLGEGCGFEAAQLASPTFTIASCYPLRDGAQLVHVDLYRLEHAAELEAAGIDDWLEPGNLVAVEWADRFAEVLPADRLDVSIERAASGLAPAQQFGEDSGPAGADAEVRRLELCAMGPRAAEVLAVWERALGSISGVEPEGER